MRSAAAARSAASVALPSWGTPIGSTEVSRTHMRSSVALRSFSIATVTCPVGSSSEVARSRAPSSWMSDIASEHRCVGLRLLDREERGAEALLQRLVGLRERGVGGTDRVVGTAVESGGEALLGLTDLFPRRPGRRLTLPY